MAGTYLAADLRLSCRMIQRAGLDPDPIFRDVGLDPAIIQRPRARCPFDRVVALWVRTVELVGNEDFGLLARSCYRPTDFHGLAVSFMASNDLRTAMRRLERYHHVVNTAVNTTLAEPGGQLQLTMSSLPTTDVSRRIQEDSRAAVIVDIARMAVDGAYGPLEIAFTYPEPEDRRALDREFRCRLRFGAPVWRLSYSVEDVVRPFLASNRELAMSQDRVLEEVLCSLRETDLSSRIKRAMVEQLSSGTPTEVSIARAVSLSPRSMQRRLSEIGTSFTNLLAEVRRELAERYVRDPALPVTEISYMLGFSDVSSFSRAFKRWTGRSPAACRRAAA